MKSSLQKEVPNRYRVFPKRVPCLLDNIFMVWFAIIKQGRQVIHRELKKKQVFTPYVI